MTYAEAQAKLEQRARLFEQRKAVLEDRSLTDADKEQRATAIDADMLKLENEARGLVQAADREAEVRSLFDKVTAGLPAVPNQRTKPVDEAAEFRALARGERSELSFDIRTATSGTAANAGNTKPTTFVAQVIEAMRMRSDFFSRARVMTTAGGETMEWPVKTGRPTVAGTTAENVAYTKVDSTWSKTNIGAQKYGIIMEATREILDDSALDILSILATDAGEAVADKVMTDLMLGDGTNKPWGWFTRATGAVNAATLSAVTFDNLLDLQFSVIAPYRRNGVYMFNDAAVKVLRKIKDTTGQYIWLPSVQAGMPDTIWGKPCLTDPNIAIAGGSAKVGVFGDPNKYLIRQVKDIKVTRSDEYGFDRDVVAFKVSWRGSGDLFDTASVAALTVTA